MKIKFHEIKKGKSVCVVDNVAGCYFNIAMELSKYFTVGYFSKYSHPFPMISMSKVGVGYDNIKIVNNFWKELDNYDIILFPDIYSQDIGMKLRKMGKMVWGGTMGEDLETDRKLFKDELKNVKMSVAPTNYVTGVPQLMSYLKDKQDKWIKVSYFRGNMETFHHVNMNQSKMWLDNLELGMGPLGNDTEFMIEDSIESVAEVGYDGWTINGMMSDNSIWGIETKDCSYIGTHVNKKDLPLPIQNTNNRFQQVLQKYNHTGFYSTEVRVGKDGSDYYTDPCMRAGSPPSNTYLNMINNWDEIILGGCNGEVIEPTYSAKYGCELILKTSYCYNNFTPISIKKEFKDNLKLKGCFRYNNMDYIVPFEQGGIKDMDAPASIVVTGDNPQTILKEAVEMADSVECYGLSYDKDALNRTMQSVNRIKNEFKIEF